MLSLPLLITAALALISISVGAGLTARSQRPRQAVIGVGIALFVVGYYLTGFTDLTYNGVLSLIDWFQRTAFTTLKAWGLGLLAAGVVLTVVGSFLTKEPKVVQAGAKKPAVASSAGVKAQPAAPRQQAQTAAANKAKGLDPEDAEIEAMLRKRGIM